MRPPTPLLITLLLASFLLAIGGCAPAPARQFVDQADRLHDGALAAAVVHDRDLTEYVQLIGERLTEAAQDAIPRQVANSFFSSLQFHFVDTPTINVFTTGGKHLYVYEGLFQFCENEDELAAAVAHTYAHVVNRDVEKLAMQPNLKAPLAEVAWQFVTDRFTVQQEEEADKLAFTLYVQGGWDPTKFENLYQRIRDRYAGAPGPGRLPIAARAQAAREWGRRASLREMRPPVADRFSFAALRHQAIASAGSANPTQGGELFLMAFPNCPVSRDLPEEQAAQARLRPPPPPAMKLEPN